MASYERQTWVDLQTPLDAAHMNHIEEGIASIVGITSIKQTATSTADGGNNVITATLDNGTTETFNIKNGSKGSTGSKGDTGAAGVGIKSVVQTTTSSADGGNNVITVTKTDGTTSTFVVKNGSKGSTGAAGAKGADGYTPVKGVDYWTEADQESIVQQVIAALGTPVFGRVDENNNIILSGDLASGTYTVKYEDSEGNTTDIGSLNAVAGSFEILPVWTEDRMIQASLSAWNLGESFTADAYAVTERISIDDSYSYTVSAEGWTAGNSCYAYWYNANGGFIAGGSISSGEGWGTSDSGDVSFTLNPPVGTRMFRLQSYCGSDFSQLSKVVVTANLDSTKKYGDSILITWQNGVKLSKTDGSVQSTGDEEYSASDFIQLDKTKTYTLYLVCDSSVNTAGNIVYYDASGNFVSYIAEPVKSTNSAFSYTLSIPENATQMRLRMYDFTHSYALIDQYYILVT